MIDGLYIDINFRNKGVATKLIKEIIREIYLLGDYEIFINVLKKNKVAVNLYKNNGFIVDQEDELKFYDFSFIVKWVNETDDGEKTTAIEGYKHHNKTVISWTKG